MTVGPQLEFFPRAGTVSFEGKTLVVPAVSIGNVGQLAADLLIATLGLEPCGTMLSPTALPAVGLGATGGSGGGDDDDEGRERLSTELELFCPAPSSSSSPSSPSSSSPSSGDGWILLQQRAPDALGSSHAAARALGAWAKTSGISRILVLASVDAADRGDAALDPASPFPSGPKTLAFVASGGGALGEWTAAESRGAGPLPPDEEGQGRAASHETGLPPRGERRLPPWPLLAAAKSGAAPPTLALLSYATEGDNAADAVALAAAAAGVLGVEPPPSECPAAAAAAAPPAASSSGRGGTIPVSGPWRAPAAWAAAYGGRAVPVEM